jgi:hypothetical protein
MPPGGFTMHKHHRMIQIPKVVTVLLSLWLPAIAGLQTVTSTLDSVAGSLKWAVARAEPGDTVIFKISAIDTIRVKTEIEIAKDLVIAGTNLATQERVTVRASGRVFSIVGGTVLIKDIILTNGYSSGKNGGNLYINGRNTMVTIENSLIVKGRSSTNLTGNGGGICLDTGSLTLADCVLSDNEAYQGSGGGIYNVQGDLTLTGCTISKNLGSNGGGISNLRGKVTIVNCTFSGDSAKNSGGAIYNGSGTVTVTGSKIIGNRAGSEGGGIYNQNGICSIVECSVESDTAASGGAIFNDGHDGTVRILASTVSGNISRTIAENVYNSGNDVRNYSYRNSGGGIYNNNGSVIITESTVSDNQSYVKATSKSSIVTLTVTSEGGGVYNHDGIVRIIRSTFTRNNAYAYAYARYSTDREYASGGGILINTGRAEIINSTLTGNTLDATSKYTSDVYCKNGTVVAIYSTIAGNSSDGICVQEGRCHLLNSIIAECGCNSSNKPDIRIINSIGCTKSLCINVDSATLAGKVFWTDSVILADNGGPTRTLTPGSSLSAAFRTGVLAGTFPVIDTSGDTLFEAAYFDGLSWLPLEKDSLIPEGSIVTEITVDQRGFIRNNPPCIGAVDLDDGEVPVRRSVPASLRTLPGVSLTHNNKHLLLNNAGDGTVELVSCSGRRIAVYSVKKSSGPVRLLLPPHAEGVALCRIVGENGIVCKKIVW